MENYDVTALGELLIDFTENGLSDQGNLIFEANPGADMMLTEDEIPEELICHSKIFHFGTLSMTHSTVRKATMKAVMTAKKAGCVISFDPNLRLSLWENTDTAREQILWGLKYCDILKISDDEILWLTGKQDYSEGICWIQDRFSIPLIFLSLGKYGSRAYYRGIMTEAKAFPNNNTIETTGAGDTFMGCILSGILNWGMDNLTQERIYKLLRFANAAASLITTRKGALKVMPEKNEIIKIYPDCKDFL